MGHRLLKPFARGMDVGWVGSVLAVQLKQRDVIMNHPHVFNVGIYIV